jgi:pSer/pThr/pTyr-binding forkhead associated (FHA) protein
MQAVLVMIRSDGERRSFSIARDMTVIGRREDCDLRIPLGEISRKHCRLVRDDESLKLEDLGSSNGTYHNGQRIQESVLAAGDTIQVGPVVFVLQLDGVPADEDLQPVASPGLETTETDMQADVTEGGNASRGHARDAEPDAQPAGEEYGVEEAQAAEPDAEGGEDLFLGAEHLVADSHAEAPAEEHEAPVEEGGKHQPHAEDLPSLDSPEAEDEELTLENLDFDANAHHPK